MLGTLWGSRLVIDLADDADALDGILTWLDERGVDELWVQMFGPVGPPSTAVIMLPKGREAEAVMIALLPACKAVSRMG